MTVSCLELPAAFGLTCKRSQVQVLVRPPNSPHESSFSSQIVDPRGMYCSGSVAVCERRAIAVDDEEKAVHSTISTRYDHHLPNLCVRGMSLCWAFLESHGGFRIQDRAVARLSR
jgi:hypothetical protein